LTPAESKSLIAKGVVGLDSVKKALKEGIVTIDTGTTNAFVYGEITGRDFMEEPFSCGIVTPERLCVSKAMLGYLDKHGHSAFWVFKKGKLRSDMTLRRALREMDEDDVLIKGANALDPLGNPGVFLGASDGGFIGKAIPTIIAKGIQLIIPVGLEKCIPIPVHEAAREARRTRIDHSMGLSVGLLPLTGDVITELAAIKILTGAEAIPIGAGGVSGAEGSVVLVVKGTKDQVQQTIQIIERIKGERPLKVIQADCSECDLCK